MIHLDTNFIIAGFDRGTPEDQQLRTWVSAHEALGISAIAWGEFICGPVDAAVAAAAAALLPNPEPFYARDADLAAQLFNAGGRRRGSLPDCMIAATAIRSGAMLATKNAGDFQRFQSFGLRLVGAQP